MPFAKLLVPHSSVLQVLGFILWAASPCLSAIAQPRDDTTKQRVRQIAERVLAPCCWREAVSVHRSPAAEAMRSEIVALVAAGRTDQQIVDALVLEHGRRLLREPDGFQRQWLYVIPVTALIISAALLAIYLRRAAKSAQRTDTQQPYPFERVLEEE